MRPNLAFFSKNVGFGHAPHARTITSFKYSLCKVAFYAKNDEDSSRKMLVVFGACGGRRE